MSNLKTGYWIYIPNEYITGDTKFRLTPNELYLYAYLYTMRTYEDKVRTSYDILQAEVSLYKKKNTNKKEIEHCLSSLQEKEIIALHEKDRVLSIAFIRHSFDGYVQLPYTKFHLIKIPRELYIYTLVAKWNKNNGAVYSYAKWAEFLGLEERQAINVINNAVEKGLIYKEVGRFSSENIKNKNQKKQEVNKYYISPVDITDKKNEEEELIDNMESVTTTKGKQKGKKKKLSEKDFDFDTGVWFKWKEYVEVSDFEIYFEVKDKQEKNNDETLSKFIDHCDKRLRIILKHAEKDLINEKMEKAMENIQKKKANKELLEIKANEFLKQQDGELFETSYKKKEQKPSFDFTDEETYSDEEDELLELLGGRRKSKNAS